MPQRDAAEHRLLIVLQEVPLQPVARDVVI